MVDQVPVDPPIAVIEWMDIYEPECQSCRVHNGIHELVHLLGAFEQPLHQWRYVLRFRRDIMNALPDPEPLTDIVLRCAIVFSDKTVIADHSILSLEQQDFIYGAYSRSLLQ